MSYSFEGKLVNQTPKRIHLITDKVLCEKCRVEMPTPKKEIIALNKALFYVYHYKNTNYFIYETRGKYSVVYCSEYCRNKHNHRFSR